MTEDTVRVQVATFESDDKQITLRLTTMDGVDIYFALDDLAFTMLSLTASPISRAVEARARVKASNIFKKDTEDE